MSDPGCCKHNVPFLAGCPFCEDENGQEIIRLRYDLAAALEREARLREALEYYANPKSYDEYGIPKIKHDEHRIGGRPCMVPDSGWTALQALAGTTQEGE